MAPRTTKQTKNWWISIFMLIWPFDFNLSFDNRFEFAVFDSPNDDLTVNDKRGRLGDRKFRLVPAHPLARFAASLALASIFAGSRPLCLS